MTTSKSDIDAFMIRIVGCAVNNAKGSRPAPRIYMRFIASQWGSYEILVIGKENFVCMLDNRAKIILLDCIHPDRCTTMMRAPPKKDLYRPPFEKHYISVPHTNP